MAFGAASVVVNQLFITFARAEWLLYLGLLFGCHGWCTSTLCRSILSKVGLASRNSMILTMRGQNPHNSADVIGTASSRHLRTTLPKNGSQPFLAQKPNAS